MAKESTVAFKGVTPISERHPELQKETVSELRELLAAVEPRLRNVFQQGQGIRLKYRDNITTYMPGEAWDVFHVEGEGWNESTHFMLTHREDVLEVGLVIIIALRGRSTDANWMLLRMIR